MIERSLIHRLLADLQTMPSVALMGPRQVGKTTLALAVAEQVPSVYLDLEDPVDLRRVSDIRAFHAANREKLIILNRRRKLCLLPCALVSGVCF